MAQVPATSYESTSLGDVAEFTIPFPFLSRAEVFVTVDGASVPFTWINDGLVQLSAVPELGAVVRRYRSTVAYVPLHQFSTGVPFLPRYVDRDFKQTLYAVQESVNDTAGTSAQALATAEESLLLVQDAFDILGERTRYIVLGAYAEGLYFETTSQVFSYAGEFYAPGPAITLPYTTTGAGAGEIANFRSVGDAVLRSDMENDIDPLKGTTLVGHMGRTLRDRLTDETFGTDYGVPMTGATGTASAAATGILAAIAANTNQVKLTGSALRASFANAADANILLDNLYRIHVDAGQVNASGTELADVRIDLPAGKITRTKRVRIRGAQHPQLQLRGAARIPLTFVSATRTWVSTTETTWNVTLSDASAVAIGDYLNCTDLTGTRVAPFAGFWPVTNVVGNVVSMRVSIRANAFTPTFTGGTFEKVPTIIEFDNSLGLQISGDWMGSSNNDAGLVDIGIVAVNPGASQNGMYMERDAKLSGLRVCIHGFGSHNYYGLPGSSWECLGFVSTASGGHNAYALSGAYFGCGSSAAGLKACTNGGALYGVALSVGATGTMTGLTSSGNGTSGIVADSNSTLIGNNMVLETNGLNGTGTVGGGITAAGDAVLDISGTSSRFNFVHSIRLLGGAQAELGAGTYNSSTGGTDVIVDDSRSFYTSSGATLGSISKPLITEMRRASIAHNFGSVPAHSEVAGPAITITGITTAMNAIVNANVNTSGINFVAKITSADTVTVYAQNVTTGAIVVSNRTFYVLGFLS